MRATLYFTIMGFVGDQEQPGQQEKRSRADRRSRVEATVAAAEDGASQQGLD